ncbi:MAG: hypothetical protein A3K19_00640 [Lentisphaerae bacterium RIFOXYB12_FULL_65_16]|nr:MAG: hypothetical protein A3K18_14870 [Lentisphaerae bacterium RIFOXYA12_64_32]OGV86797.1 MAG: hypothetical protein A3K19_00640 [Lentisphaerae bacterium RIFOXYB12_FULL_65_16]
MRAERNERKATAGRYQVPALARGMQILEFLAGRPDGASPVEIAAQLHLPKPSVFRMLVTLTDLGYLHRDGDGSVYRLSRKMLSLGYAAIDERGLIEKSMDVLRHLRDATGETALIAVLAGREGVVLEQVPSPSAVKVLVQIGHRFPLHTAAPGKALLAVLPESERGDLVRSLEYTRFNRRTIVGPAAMHAELARVRELGYAVDRGEELEDIRCVAAAVLDHRGYPLAAIWIGGPASRLADSALAGLGRIVAEHARRISGRFR